MALAFGRGFVRINGNIHYLWRAVDQEGEVLEAYVTKSRNRKAAFKFLRKVMKRYGQPKTIVTDKLGSYRAALRTIVNAACQETGRWLNNRVENSHQPLRRRERAMQRSRQMMPANTPAIWGYFYGVSLPEAAAYLFGAIEIALAIGLFLGLYPDVTYAAAALLHTVSVAVSWRQLIAPWADPANHLFIAGLPVLGAFVALHLLRRWDRIAVRQA